MSVFYLHWLVVVHPTTTQPSFTTTQRIFITTNRVKAAKCYIFIHNLTTTHIILGRTLCVCVCVCVCVFIFMFFWTWLLSVKFFMHKSSPFYMLHKGEMQNASRHWTLSGWIGYIALCNDGTCLAYALLDISVNVAFADLHVVFSWYIIDISCSWFSNVL